MAELSADVMCKMPAGYIDKIQEQYNDEIDELRFIMNQIFDAAKKHCYGIIIGIEYKCTLEKLKKLGYTIDDSISNYINDINIYKKDDMKIDNAYLIYWKPNN